MDDIEITAVKKASKATQTQQEEEVSSVDWRIVGIISAALVLVVSASWLSWNAHGWFVRPTYTKATAEIERRFGSDASLAYEESTRTCPDDANLTRACGLLHDDMRSHQNKLASANAHSNVEVPR